MGGIFYSFSLKIEFSKIWKLKDTVDVNNPCLPEALPSFFGKN